VHERSEVHQAELAELADVLSQARDLGVANLGEIADREHAVVGLSYADCLTYLRDHLHFYLGPRERAGLQLFEERAQTMKLAPNASTQLAEAQPGLGASPIRARSEKPGAGLLPAKGKASV
jgi:hypothetical protein